jgi:hypothetical protein
MRSCERLNGIIRTVLRGSFDQTEFLNHFDCRNRCGRNLRLVQKCPSEGQNGAPLSTHLRTRSGPIPAGQDRSFEHVFAAFDTDLYSAADYLWFPLPIGEAAAVGASEFTRSYDLQWSNDANSMR